VATLTYTHPHHLSKLSDELMAAVPSIAPVPGPDGVNMAVMTLSDDGGDVITMTVPDEADEAAIAAVVAAHDPTPPPAVFDYVETLVVSAVARTTDGGFREIWRLPTSPKHTYRAALEMRATDAMDQTTKVQEARLVFKGLSGSVVQVGTTTVLWSAPDAGTTAWAIQAQAQGQDLVFGVRGAAGKTIDWSMSGEIVVFAPEGLQST
jgi:hypothetical protein